MRTEKARSHSHRELAIAFLRAAAVGRARDAFAQHAVPGFRHHNPFFPGDADSLAAGMDDNAAKFPDKVLTVRHALEDGDYVAVHSEVHMQPGDPGFAVVHLIHQLLGRLTSARGELEANNLVHPLELA